MDTTPEERAFRAFCDPQGMLEVDPALLACLSNAEVAELDQLLASRHAIVAAGLGSGRTETAARQLEQLVLRLDWLLTEAIARRTAKEAGR